MAGAGVELDPEALHGIAADLAAAALAVRTLSGHVEPATAAAAHFGAPDADGRLAARLAGRCDDVLLMLSQMGQLASTLAEELRATAELVCAVDEHSARNIRVAED